MIIGLVAFVFLMQRRNGGKQASQSPQSDLSQLTFQSKVVLGIKVVSESNPLLEDQQQDQPQIKFGEFGSVRVRQAGAVMVAELKSNEDALIVMSALEDKAKSVGYQFSETEKTTNALLRTLFHDSVAALSPTEKEHLLCELLWFGELALHPETQKPDLENPKPDKSEADSDLERKRILQDAQSTFFTVLGLTLMIFAGLIVGFIGLVVMSLLYARGNLEIRTKMKSGDSSVYLESFTVWMLSFVLFSLLLGYVAPKTNPLVANVVVFFASMISGLLWSLLRGRFDAPSRTDIGFCGNPLKEVPVAIWCYICSLPLVAFGLITSILMISAASDGKTSTGLESSAPAHPFLEWVTSGDTNAIALIFFIACFCAPLVEETMFRGFLYRSLRDRSSSLGHFGSTLISALVNGLLFAAIHPQGIMFIPALCALGVGFSFAREWRGSLWTPIFMHALHNAIITCTLVFVVSA